MYIYAYTKKSHQTHPDPQWNRRVKVGQTKRYPEKRLLEQGAQHDEPLVRLFSWIVDDRITDHQIHRKLEDKKHRRISKNREWFLIEGDVDEQVRVINSCIEEVEAGLRLTDNITGEKVIFGETLSEFETLVIKSLLQREGRDEENESHAAPYHLFNVAALWSMKNVKNFVIVGEIDDLFWYQRLPSTSLVEALGLCSWAQQYIGNVSMGHKRTVDQVTNNIREYIDEIIAADSSNETSYKEIKHMEIKHMIDENNSTIVQKVSTVVMETVKEHIKNLISTEELREIFVGEDSDVVDSIITLVSYELEDRITEYIIQELRDEFRDEIELRAVTPHVGEEKFVTLEDTTLKIPEATKEIDSSEKSHS